MPINDTLQEIAEGISIESSCPATVETVLIEAFKNRMFGERLLVKPVSGDTLYRLNRNGEVIAVNWHEVAIFQNSGSYVIDIDSPEKVYEFEDYKRKCLPDYPDVLFMTIEES